MKLNSILQSYLDKTLVAPVIRGGESTPNANVENALD